MPTEPTLAPYCHRQGPAYNINTAPHQQEPAKKILHYTTLTVPMTEICLPTYPPLHTIHDLPTLI